VKDESTWLIKMEEYFDSCKTMDEERENKDDDDTVN
jgi:hypothetical protein